MFHWSMGWKTKCIPLISVNQVSVDAVEQHLDEGYNRRFRQDHPQDVHRMPLGQSCYFSKIFRLQSLFIYLLSQSFILTPTWFYFMASLYAPFSNFRCSCCFITSTLPSSNSKPRWDVAMFSGQETLWVAYILQVNTLWIVPFLVPGLSYKMG